MARSSRRSLFLVVFFLLACGFLGILFAQRSGQQSSMTGDSDVKDSLKQFTDVYSLVEDNYAEPVNPDKAIYNGAIPGMLHALGAELLPADADTLRRPHDWMNIQEIVSIRRILAAHGDRLARVSAPAGLAARKVCCEIVGATGAALALIDYVSLV